MLAVTAVAICGCGQTKYANRPRPPLPVALTVYINPGGVSVSPASVGAGLANFTVTNQATRAEALSIVPNGASGNTSETHTAPINPQGTAQVSVNLQANMTYTLSASDGSSNRPPKVAQVSVTKQRAGSGDQVVIP